MEGAVVMCSNGLWEAEPVSKPTTLCSADEIDNWQTKIKKNVSINDAPAPIKPFQAGC